jgi:hypothetical protein
MVGVLSLFLLASCKGEPTGNPSGALSNNKPPAIIAARILGDLPSLAKPIAVQVEAEDPEREAVSFHYQWFVDDAPIAGQINATLPQELLRRGQRVSVEIVPIDTGGQKGIPYRTAAVVIGNTPPFITRVALLPREIKAGEKVEVEMEADDADHDQVTLTYRWFKNDAVVKEGVEPFLDTQGFLPGDAIAVEVTPSDVGGTGPAVKSSRMVLGNSLPRIVSSPPAALAQSDRYEYLVQAIDSDGDHLRYSLASGPPGMTIGERSGLVEWPIPANLIGSFHVKIQARDTHDGAAVQEFDLTLSASAPQKPAGA